MKVVVVGAGIGGLTLAQALHRAGDEVRVYDRDSEVSATGGYRLHLDDLACHALRRHLPPALLRAVWASSAGPAAFRRFAVTDHRLRPLVIATQDPAVERLLIGRVPLRRLLTVGLEDRVRFAREFTHHEVHPDATVTAHFADGSSERADLLVGADGVGSRVARAMAGRPTSAPVGLSGLAGRTPIDARTRSLLPELLQAGPALALASGGVGMFLSLHDPTDEGTQRRTDDAPTGGEVAEEVAADLEEPALVWGLIALDRLLPRDVRRLDPHDLVAVAEGMLVRWSDRVRALVGASDPSSVAAYGFSAADPGADLTPWIPGTVTCLGDAVHAMPPTGGRAAATAIRDADVLATHLAAARAGTTTIPGAVSAFHTEMAGYAPAAVRESLTPLRWIRATSGPTAVLAGRAALPLAASITQGYRSLRRRGGDRARSRSTGHG